MLSSLSSFGIVSSFFFTLLTSLRFSEPLKWQENSNSTWILTTQTHMHVQMYYSYTLLCCLMLILCSSEKPKCVCSAPFCSALLCYGMRWFDNDEIEMKTKPFDKKIKQLFQQHKYCNNYVCRGMKEFSLAMLPKRRTRNTVCKLHWQRRLVCTVPWLLHRTIDRLAENETERRHASKEQKQASKRASEQAISKDSNIVWFGKKPRMLCEHVMKSEII